jgi:outer membrane protein assembly factor BamD
MTAMTHRHLTLLACALAAAIMLAGCGSTSKEDPNSTAAVEKLYADAKSDLNNGSYDAAIKSLERVEGRAAGTLLAQQALLDIAYAQHKSRDKAAALASINRFITLYPSSPVLDYALYMRGIVNFNENMGILSTLSRQDLSERDQQASRDSYQAFRQLVEQFPTSRYTPDAQARMDYIVNSLAEYEVHVSRYYYRRGAYLAAVNRAQQSVIDFPQSPANEEGLYIMVASYDKLGLTKLRDDTQRVLLKNFPNTRYIKDGVRIADRAWWQFW